MADKTTMLRSMLIGILLLAIMFVIVLSIYRIIRTSTVIQKYYNQGQWERMQTNFAKTKQHKNMVILFGESMTEQMGLYLQPNDSLVNMGISGDFTFGLLKRSDAVIDLKPAKIFIMIGINDIIEQVPIEQIKENYERLIDKLKSGCPEAKIYIQSTLPTYGLDGNISSSKSIKLKVRILNNFLQFLCAQKQVTYIDLYSLLSDDKGNLKKELTTDGIHLNENGYEIWITELVENYQLTR